MFSLPLTDTGRNRGLERERAWPGSLVSWGLSQDPMDPFLLPPSPLIPIEILPTCFTPSSPEAMTVDQFVQATTGTYPGSHPPPSALPKPLQHQSPR